ncbi:MAG: glycosyltransferase [Tabrizicola sp.]|nr:glycosyltransferase [Tabrizicola sp.]
MLEHQLFRQPDRDEPLVLALFSYRYDAHLVPDLLENLRPGIHGYVAWDDRSADAALTDEPTRRNRLITASRELGASWLLTADPDERLERGFADVLPGLVAQGRRFVWAFRTCEMFDPGHFRVDGPWGGKQKVVLCPIEAGRIDPSAALHGSIIGDGAGFALRDARINLYHLRMALPARRKLRRDLYAAADQERRFQDMGYDYLADERGMVLQPLTADRNFLPPFIEDHGLWSPDPGALGEIRPDPYPNRFLRAARSAQRQGQTAAHHVLRDLHKDSPQDHDLWLLSLRLALQAGLTSSVIPETTAALDQDPDDILPRLMRAEALVAEGDCVSAAADIARLAASLPDSPVIAALAEDAGRATADLKAPDAAWRRVAPPDATLAEGSAVAHADLVTIVIGYQSQPGLLPAVRSLLDQDTATEIVVVNSGGGEVLRDMAPVADRIRLVTCKTPLFVGAARNIGVAASRAPFVAFLAGDCLARPGWVSSRLRHHRAGAAVVSSAIAPPDGAGLFAQIATGLTYANRAPDTPARLVQHYGLSYARWHLTQCGQFPPGLRVAEDTALNRVSRRFATPVWTPEVQTIHADPDTLRAVLADARGRGRRRVFVPPLRNSAASAGETITAQVAWRLAQLGSGRTETQTAAERRAIAAMQWLVVVADAAGSLEGFRSITKADTLARAAKDPGLLPAKALALGEAAFELDPQDAEKARLLGTLRLSGGDDAGAELAFRTALALTPGDHEAAKPLLDIVAGRDGSDAALAEAERIALAAPTRSRLWDLAADRASHGGRARWAVALGQIALSCALDDPWLHGRLATWHDRNDDPVAKALRAHTARSLRTLAPT